MGLKIRALPIGRLHGFPQPAITYMRGWGKTVDPQMIMFVIEGGAHPIVVDTGTSDASFTHDHHGYDLRRDPDEEPLAALEAAGIDADSVQTVIHTHLHWDHCSNNHLFPNARFLVQEAELRYAIDPAEPTRVAFERTRRTNPPWLSVLTRIETVRGDVEIEPGVSVVALPGHTPGSQGILVDTDQGPHLLAGDCVDTYENWNGDANPDGLRHIPSGSFTDLIAYMDSFRRIEELDCEVVPGHDEAVVKTGVFG